MKASSLEAIGLSLAVVTGGCAGKIDQVRPAATSALNEAPRKCHPFRVSLDGREKPVCANIIEVCIEGTRKCLYIEPKVPVRITRDGIPITLDQAASDGSPVLWEEGELDFGVSTYDKHK